MSEYCGEASEVTTQVSCAYIYRSSCCGFVSSVPTRGEGGIICGHANAWLKPDHLWISCFPSGLIHHVIDFQRARVGKYPRQSVPEMGRHLNTDARCSARPSPKAHADARRQLQADYVASDKSCNSFVFPPQIFASKCFIAEI